MDLAIDPTSALIEWESFIAANLEKDNDTTISDTLDEDIWNIPIFEGTDSENELELPVFHIHTASLNENMSLWTGDAEDFIQI